MAELALELLDCVYRYDGQVPALDGVSCAVERGSWTALVGQNGSGKTTLAKLCNGLLRPQSGQVRVMGTNARGRPVGVLARQVGYLFQNPDHQLFAPTVRDEIAFGLKNFGLTPEERRNRTEEALHIFDLAPYADRPPAVLGFGIRRLVTLASLFAVRPPVLILDEPTRGLDWGSTSAVLDRLKGLHQAGHTILFITHQMRLVAEWATRVLVLHRGRLLADGTPSSVLAQESVITKASLAPPPVGQLSRRLAPLGMASDCMTIDEFYEAYLRLTGGRGEHPS